MWIYFKEIRREIVKFVGIFCVYSFFAFSNVNDVKVNVPISAHLRGYSE